MNGDNMNKGPSALSCQKLTKAFGGLEAVKDVDLRVSHGDRRAIIGPNGAGKTTFFNLNNGQYPATSGSIELLGRNVTKLPAHKRAALGLGRTFQITNLFPTKTVIDNLVISAMGLMSTKFSMFRPLSSYRPLYEMDVALSVANSITVLHEGRVFMEGSADEVQGNAKVQEIYFGEEQRFLRKKAGQ